MKAKNKKPTENEKPINLEGPKITKANGFPIDGVFVIITKLMGYASKYTDNERLGAFHRRLAHLLLYNLYDETDAGQFAKELLESAQIFSKKQSDKGKKGNEKRWGTQQNLQHIEPHLAPFPDGYTPDGTGGNPF